MLQFQRHNCSRCCSNKVMNICTTLQNWPASTPTKYEDTGILDHRVTFIVINPVCVVIPDAVADLNVCVFVLLDGGDSKILAENLLTPGTDNTDNHLLLGRSPGCGKLTSPSSVSMSMIHIQQELHQSPFHD